MWVSIEVGGGVSRYVEVLVPSGCFLKALFAEI